jgi:hypothetical protein
MDSWLGEHGNNWRAWAGSAETMLRAAKILNRQAQNKLWDVELMLQGYVLEDLLNSWYLKNGGQLYDSKGKFCLKGKTRNHNLIALADAIGYSLDTRFHKMADRLTRFVRWAGRYPCGLTDEETSAFWGPSDQTLLDELVTSLHTELRDTRSSQR